jgi:ketol-acid reductoisomerase
MGNGEYKITYSSFTIDNCPFTTACSLQNSEPEVQVSDTTKMRKEQTVKATKSIKQNQLTVKLYKMAKLNFGGVEENVVTRDEFPLAKAQEVLKDEVVAVIGYGVQGPGQALNQKENGINVIVGQRKNSKSWDKAVKDGFVPGQTLFEIEEALEKGTIICYLLSDAAQIAMWPTVKKHLTPGKALYFSHGFGVTYNDQTGIVPPADVDVFLVAPKGSGTSLRRMFLQGRGLNSSYAIFQDATGRAFDRVVALGIAIGSGYLFETNFKKEVYSDLTGERGTLMGAIQGIFAAQYQVLRSKGHTPSEAFNETVEELTQSLMPLVAENGMDWMYANCSTTAQRGALDWWKKFRDATLPVFTELYESVASGKEAAKSIESNSKADYREKLDAELKELHDSEIWQAGRTVRSLRPENQPAK